MRIDRRSFVIGALSAAAASGPARGQKLAQHAQAAPLALHETPLFAEKVAAGELPPISLRAPVEPLISNLEHRGRSFGRQGGAIRTLIAKPKNIRYIVVWGYARLLGYDENYTLWPDILKSVEVEEMRRFTLHLREGHKWSDGAAFTAEDFRYWWEDVANNIELSPSGPPQFMLVNGAAPQFEVLSPTAVRYSWPAANPLFLPELARARPAFIYRPAHYMRQFHAQYADPMELIDAIALKKARNWAQLHNAKDNLYKFDNPALPTLQPWRNVTPGKKLQRYVMERNPYFHRFDSRGRQLPYIDHVEMNVASSGLVPAKAKAGQVDLQAKAVGFEKVGVLKSSEEDGGYQTRLWTSGVGSEIALYPNLTTKDKIWRAIMRNGNVRRALSMGVDRELINETLYFGLAKPVGNSALPESPLYDASFASSYARYNPERADKMLDEAGLANRRSDGVRLLPDGRPFELIVETFGEREVEIDALQLVAETWREIGVKLLTRPSDRDIVRNRAYAGLTVMTAGLGWDNGVPTASTNPAELAPTQQDMMCWPAWGQYHQTQGELGEQPVFDPASRLNTLHNNWLRANNDDARARIWREMLAIHADQLFVIGLVAQAPQPVVVSNRMRNVPQKAVYSWDPGAHFGVHHMDEWWVDDAERKA